MPPTANPFIEETEPYLPVLLEMAGHDLRYHEARGDIAAGELTPEEVVGEALIRANYERRRRPPDVPLRTWLLAMQIRVLDQLLEQRERETKRWAVSLDQPIPSAPAPFRDDSFWDWYQPDEVIKYEDQLPVASDDPASLLGTEYETALEPPERRAWLLHDVQGLSLEQVAIALHLSARTARELVEQARTKLARLNGG